ncbi:MAG: VOC family protein [Actinomycetota bacterium]
MMRISHVLYKVPDLDAAVERYRQDGFDVDYGRAKNPNNALAYFADGSYLELLGRTGMPSMAKTALRLFGKRAFVNRLSTWDDAAEGLIGLALESEPDRLEDAKQMLQDAGHGWFQFRARRTEPEGRVLKFVGVMPDEMQIPFFGTCDTDLGRPGFVHPNGVVGFKHISFGTTEELLPLVERLCTDDRVELFIGDGVKELEFEYAHG